MKAWAWEEMAMGKCLPMAPNMFSQILWHLRRGRRNQTQTLLSKCGRVLSTIIGHIDEWWVEHFEEHLNPVNMPSFQDTVPDIYGAFWVYLCGWGYYCTWNFHSSKVPWEDKIWHCWRLGKGWGCKVNTHCYMKILVSTFGKLGWSSPFLKKGTRRCVPIIRVSQYSDFQEKSIKVCDRVLKRRLWSIC